jgi:ubiquinone/menaquinone biosynthesis C-methylase UbiE
MSDAQKIAATEGLLWGDKVKDSYFDVAERGMEGEWQSLVWPMLRAQSIDYSHTLDLAAGHGRNSVKLLRFAQNITIVDLNEENIAYCKKRFAGDNRFRFVKNDGVVIPDVDDNSITFFYTFDSMVHFDLEIVQSYVKEAFRVLVASGTAFFHYSNYVRAPGADFRMNPHWRNFMSKSLFEHLALRAGFTIMASTTCSWAGIADLDAITLVRKPGSAP